MVDVELGAWNVLEMPIVLLDLTVLVVLILTTDVLAFIELIVRLLIGVLAVFERLIETIDIVVSLELELVKSISVGKPFMR